MSSYPVCRPEGTIGDGRIFLIKISHHSEAFGDIQIHTSPMQLLCNSKPHADKLCEYLTAWFPFYARTGFLPSTFLFANDCVSLDIILFCHFLPYFMSCVADRLEHVTNYLFICVRIFIICLTVKWQRHRKPMARVYYLDQCVQRLPFHLTHWGRDQIDAISQMTFSNTFSWIKMFKFRLRFHWSLFPRVQLTIF